MSILKLLGSAARSELTPAFLEGQAGVDVKEHTKDFHREVDLEPLRRILEEAKIKFDGRPVEDSDAWLAPRVHATLRLTRREAADMELWSYLAMIEFPEYVRWRWGTPAPLGRFVGSETNQALARLWWGAELTRNGSDYSAVEKAFEAQDIPNTWFRLDAFHHRPAALAALRVMDDLKGGPLPNGTQVKRTRKINMLATAFNTALSTTVLDAVVPPHGEDADAVLEWVDREVDETLMLNELPTGPDDESVSDEAVAAADKLIRSLAEGAGLFYETSVERPASGPGPKESSADSATPVSGS